MINLSKLPNQQRNESCKLFLRRHWLEIAKIVGLAAILLILPTILGFMFLSFDNDFMSNPLLGPLFSLVASGYLFVILVISLNQFTDYYLDTWIVTTERIINIEQIGLFSRVISELHLNQIQDITSETHGMLATFLTYGNVYVQTAGAKQRFVFKTIDNPDDVKEKVLALVEINKRRRGDASMPITVSEALTSPE